METQLCTVVWLLVIAVANGQVRRIPASSLDIPDNSICPLDSQLTTVRTEISNNLAEILIEVAEEIEVNTAVTYTLPECGGGEWRRVAYLDMTDLNQTCPQPWVEVSRDSVRACGREWTDPHSAGACYSVQFSAYGHEYTQVCGRIIGYQYGSPDGLDRYHLQEYDINGTYVDGVSVTHGMPRQHIWSLFGGTTQYSDGCCTSAHYNQVIRNALGDDFFCDTGNVAAGAWYDVLFTQHPLWDGISGCSSSSTCCAPNSGPWFSTTLAAATTDDIEVRICGNSPVENEDTPLEHLEIYEM